MDMLKTGKNVLFGLIMITTLSASGNCSFDVAWEGFIPPEDAKPKQQPYPLKGTTKLLPKLTLHPDGRCSYRSKGTGSKTKHNVIIEHKPGKFTIHLPHPNKKRIISDEDKDSNARVVRTKKKDKTNKAVIKKGSRRSATALPNSKKENKRSSLKKSSRTQKKHSK